VKSGMGELEQALAPKASRAECVGASEFPTREDVLLAIASPDALETVERVKGA
jgi:hypothetical protein